MVVERVGDVVVLWVDHPPVNALALGVRTGLHDGVRSALEDVSVRAIVIAARGVTFPAGADVREFKTVPISEVINEIEASSKPVVAALHGTCFGGGLELALGCHYRVCVASAKFGLPEVKLGLLPGAGGTQRLPRLIGCAAAAEMICSGDPIGAERARSLGIVDAVVATHEELVRAAVRMASEVRAPRRVSELKATPLSDADFARISQQYARTKRGFQAPQVALRAVQAAGTAATFADGMAAERELFLELFQADEARCLQYLFFAEREAARVQDAGGASALPVKSVGVVGAGTMGAGIAHSFLVVGVRVVLLEANRELLDRGVATVRKTLQSLVERKRITAAGVQECIDRLTPTLDYAAFADCDMVIEAAFEDMVVKKKIFAELDRVCKPSALLCSNTSSLDIDAMASATRRPAQVAGMHFFAPAHVMRLLENIRGKQSSAQTLVTIMDVGKRIGKVCVLVGNCPWFVGNRMLEGYVKEAVYLVEEGATVQQVDAALVAFGMPMGPFQMGDMSGLDVSWRIRKGNRLTGPDRDPAAVARARYCELPDAVCELGRFGQKTGKGWYAYDAGSRTPKPDPAVDALVAEHRKRKGIAPRAVEDGEIVERCILPLVLEGLRVLEEGIAVRPGDIDVIWANGYGFPAYRGGPMMYGDLLGWPTVAERAERYGTAFPNVPHWRLPDLARTLAARDGATLQALWRKRAQQQGDGARSKM